MWRGAPPFEGENGIDGAEDTLASMNRTLDDSESPLSSFGVHIGTVGEASGPILRGLDASFGLTHRHALSQAWFGEARATIGMLNGPEERIRLIPVEYRFHYRLDRHTGQRGEGRPIASPYLYTGAGLLYHKPLEVQRPEDPYTREMRGRLPVSDFWNFESGMTPLLPVGVGLELRLDNHTRLDMQVGYHQAVHWLGSFRGSYRGGYVGLNIGLRIGRAEGGPAPVREASPSLTAPRRPRPSVAATFGEGSRIVCGSRTTPETRDLTSMIVERMGEPIGPYPVMSLEIKQDQLDRLVFIGRVLRYLDKGTFEISGHSDFLGLKPVKKLIAESRARSAWL